MLAGVAVTTCAAQERGVVGAVIDGFLTDRSFILATGFPVWRRGRSPITTKPRGFGGDINVPINCGGAAVRPNDIILADESGVVVLEPTEAQALAERAQAMQDKERLILERLKAGETLAQITDLSK
ncbi:RraA family protein [Epibacterium ulvae]|uniref:RraA family protein n=1 Tax=Epibacterium ulvae TaxID=1156985 RepID=UPI002493B15C|nr:hypothetical protein [Epibacterium ulvae]